MIMCAVGVISSSLTSVGGTHSFPPDNYVWHLRMLQHYSPGVPVSCHPPVDTPADV